MLLATCEKPRNIEKHLQIAGSMISFHNYSRKLKLESQIDCFPTTVLSRQELQQFEGRRAGNAAGLRTSGGVPTPSSNVAPRRPATISYNHFYISRWPPTKRCRYFRCRKELFRRPCQPQSV